MGLNTIQLEVVAANRRATALYSKLGFVPMRDLGLWERNTPPPAPEPAPVRADVAVASQPGARVGAVRMPGVLPLVDAFNEIRPCWQNEAQSLVKMSDRLVGYVSHLDSAATAYVLFGESAGGLYIADFAAASRLGNAQRQSMCEFCCRRWTATCRARPRRLSTSLSRATRKRFAPAGSSLPYPAGDGIVLKVAIATFATVFLAELGDKTQLATMLLVAQGKSPLAVFLGSASALVVSSLVGVLAGGVVAKYIPEIWVRIAAGSGFIILGVLLLLGRF